MQNVYFCLPRQGLEEFISLDRHLFFFFPPFRDEPLVAYQSRERVSLVDDLDGF